MRKTIPVLVAWLVASGPAFSQDGFEELAKTPPMGWNSWNTFRKDIHEDLVKEIADAFMDILPECIPTVPTHRRGFCQFCEAVLGKCHSCRNKPRE